ncbi:hypothetical protein [Microcella sp.]|uniref:hypothetical protein n=1 Tax=Microcella sp. TaxID=1913979 RepID=UPI003918C012
MVHTVRQYEGVTDHSPERKARSPRKIGGWLIGGAFALTVALAFLPTGEAWAVTVAAILVLVAGGLQFGGAMMFDKSGRADPAHAKAAVSRLVLLNMQAKRARLRAGRAFADQSGSALKASTGQLSVDLAYIEEGIALAARDWELFHPDVIAGLAEEVQKQDQEEETM